MAAAADKPLPSESISTIDIHHLSQSELLSLSLCSSSAIDPKQNVVIPRIDPTVFNESAASRKQTYSPRRLSRRRAPHLQVPEPASLETEQAENQKIVSVLRALFAEQANPNGVTLPQIQHITHIPSLPVLPDTPIRNVMAANSNNLMSANNSNNGGLIKRKRGRPRKDKGVQDSAATNSMNGGLAPSNKGVQDGLKRKRGRPRKDRSMMMTASTTAMVVAPEATNEGNVNNEEMVVNPEAKISSVGDEGKNCKDSVAAISSTIGDEVRNC